MKKLLSIILVLVMIMAMVPAAALQSDFQMEGSENPESDAVFDDGKEEIGANDIVTFMVKLKDKPVAAVVGNINSVAAKKKTAELSVKQNDIENRIKDFCDDGDNVEVTRRYSALFNGFAVRAPFYMKERMESIPGVTKVFVEPAYEMPPIAKAEDEKLNTSVDLIHAHDAWDAGYTGKGTVIAIVDSGCVVDHQAFSTAPASPKLNRNSIANVLKNYNMQAERISSGQITADALYYSSKIPFRFNYVTGTNDVSHRLNKNDHGSHVAGIAAGYNPNSEYNGVAKDAQLVIMNIFDGAYTRFSVMLTALEDCVYLGVDTINMSLGISCGFTHDSYDSQEVFDLLDSCGCNVVCASGNSGSYDGTQFYGSKNRYSLTMNPDNGVLAFPASVNSNVAVGACSESGGSIASFTSRGTTSDLKLKPEITAPGSNIIAPVDSMGTGTTTNYGEKSGTSMSSPHVVGTMSIVSQYVGEKWPDLTGKAKHDMIHSLVMCTADTLSNVTPLAQGSGIVNVLKAVSTGAYIKVDGCSKPKLELGDDPNKTGVFTLDFKVVNFSGSPLTYTVEASVFTEGFSSVKINNKDTYRMNGTARNLKSDCTVTGEGTITVPARSEKAVSVTITLNAGARELLDTYYCNGGYVEGYVRLRGETDLTVPYLGFYGNWNRASVFDRYTFIDEIKGVNKFNAHARQLMIGSVGDSGCLPLGKNPYMTSTNWFADRCTLSPNGDGLYESINQLDFTILRNCREIGFEIYNEADPTTVYYSNRAEYISKYWEDDLYMTDELSFNGWSPAGLKDGDRIVFRLYAELDNPGFTHDQNECSEIVLPIAIDTKAPEITYWKFENNLVTLRIHDDNYAAWLGLYADPECTQLIKQRAINEYTRGAETAFTLIVDDYSTVYAKVGDYGFNTSDVYTITGEGGIIALDGIELAPGSFSMDVNTQRTVTLSATPASADNYSVVWSSSDSSIASVTGSKNEAVVTAKARGNAVIQAVATDLRTGNSFTGRMDVTVIDDTDCYYTPVDQFDTDETYLIGCRNGDDVYIIMNYNPDPILDNTSSNNYRLYYNSDYYSYGIKAVTDSAGNILDVSKSEYPDAKASNAEWKFVSYGNYYMIQSAANSNYHLRVSTTTTRIHLYNTSGTSYATKWLWDSANKCLYYYVSSSLSKKVTFMPTVGSYSNLFCAAGTSSSTVQLYKKTFDIPLPAQPNMFQVTFKDWDGTVLKTELVAEGGAATAPANPTRTGYTFTGWDRAFNNITANTVVTAQYSINSYTVSFKDWDGTILKTQTVNYGGAATAPANPTREGYTFTGWDKAFNNITANTVVTAQYTKNAIANYYTVTFKDWDGTILKTELVEEGRAATAPADPTRAGYTFTGWDTAFNCVTSDMIVTAQYAENCVADRYMPVNNIVAGKEYLIGYKYGNSVYLVMNYNPDPLTSPRETSSYRYSDGTTYHAYGVKAVTDENGNIIDVSREIYPNARLEHAKWKFITSSVGYRIRSIREATMYLTAHVNRKYAHLYVINGYNNSIDWNWNSGNSTMTYTLKGGDLKYMSFVPIVNDYINFFKAGTNFGTVLLYRKVEQIRSYAISNTMNIVENYISVN